MSTTVTFFFGSRPIDKKVPTEALVPVGPLVSPLVPTEADTISLNFLKKYLLLAIQFFLSSPVPVQYLLEAKIRVPLRVININLTPFLAKRTWQDFTVDYYFH